MTIDADICNALEKAAVADPEPHDSKELKGYPNKESLTPLWKLLKA